MVVRILFLFYLLPPYKKQVSNCSTQELFMDVVSSWSLSHLFILCMGQVPKPAVWLVRDAHASVLLVLGVLSRLWWQFLSFCDCVT